MEIDYLSLLLDLFRDAFTFRQYKKMNSALAVFVGILQIPFVLLSFALFLEYGLVAFMFKYLKAPLEYYLNFVHAEGDRVKHGTQAVIYFVAFPFAAVCQVFLSFLLLALFMIWFMMVIVVKIWTLCGVNFSVFINQARKNLVKDGGLMNPTKPTVHVCIGYSLLLVWLILLLADQISYNNAMNAASSGYYGSSARYDGTAGAIAYFVFFALIAFNVLYCLIAYRSRLNADGSEKAVTASAEEQYTALLNEGVITKEEYDSLTAPEKEE